MHLAGKDYADLKTYLKHKFAQLILIDIPYIKAGSSLV